MLDLIVKTREEFINSKHQFQIDHVMNEKYILFLKSYECFSLKCLSIKNIPHHKSHIRRKQIDEINHGKTKTIDKTLQGILNIINMSNYSKNLNKIRLQVSDDNIETVIAEILNKCCVHIFYLQVFLKLIKDIDQLSGYHAKIVSQIQKFISDFIAHNEEYTLDHVAQVDDYDDFCKQQKQKVHAISKNKLIIELIMNHDNVYDINKYFLYFSDILHHTNENNFDIIILIVFDIVKTCKRKIKEEHLIQLKYNIGMTLKACAEKKNMKRVFIIQDLLCEI